MSEDKRPDIDPGEALAALDQLSRTIGAMTCVVDRLRRHLRERLEALETQSGAAGTEGGGRERTPPSRAPDAITVRRGRDGRGADAPPEGPGRDRTAFVAESRGPGTGFPDGRRRILH